MAALTMPSLITKHQKMVFATKAKQTYSILSNALITSVAENGPMSEWYYPDSNIISNEDYLKFYVDTYFKPYLKVSKDYGFKNNNYHILLSNGMTLSFSSNGILASDGTFDYASVIIIVSDYRNIDGAQAPSRDYSRHDLMFEITSRFAPFCWGDKVYSYQGIKNRDEIINNKAYGCNKDISKERRYNCTALLMYDNWVIKDDYPW